jgi:hypothetical protein
MEVADDVSKASSTSMDLYSTCSTDNYSSDCFEHDLEDNKVEVGATAEVSGGNRLLNLKKLNRVLTSIDCCKHCAASSHQKLMDNFIDFCQSETSKIINSCWSLSYHDKK